MPPRPLRPKKDAAADSSAASDDPRGNKRRAVSSACIPCRKRKSKCDGQVPACSTCVAVYRTPCSYDENSDHRRRGAWQRDIQSLQQQNDALDVIVASLRSLPEDEAFALLTSLRGDASFDALAESLRNNVRLPDNFAPQTLEADLAQQISPTDPSFENPTFQSTLPSQQPNDAPVASSASSEKSTTWFRTPQDAELVEHLLNLFFCWVNPFYCFLAQEHFIHDMGLARTDFCSPMLVNAVLAFASHYSDRPQARRIATDPGTAGDNFFAEARHLLDQSDKPCLTTVQALGIMSLRETSAGRDSNGYQLAGRCLRMALELGLHLSSIKNVLRSPEAEVRKTVFWAVFNLETFGRLSQLPRAAADIEIPALNLRSELHSWRPYEDSNLAVSPSAEQPARTAVFREQLSKLTELASDMVNTFYAPRERFTSRQLAATYTQYQEWYRNLPDVFRLENTTLPHVVILHMYYFGCVLHLFRPYIKLDLRNAHLYPRDACTFCANEISALMHSLRAMYGLRRVCLATIQLLLSASTIHLLNLPSETATSHLIQGMQDLQAMSVNHKFAARAVDIIRSLSSKWDIALPEGAAAVSVQGSGQQEDISPPPASTFFAASIPRKESSSEAGTQSNESSSNQQDAQFAPPSLAHAPPSSSTSTHSFYGEPATPSDASQMQNAFWTPFPAQGIPHLQAPLSSHVMDLSQYEGHQPWAMYPESTSAPSEFHARQQSAPGRIDENMGGMGDWSWQ